MTPRDGDGSGKSTPAGLTLYRCGNKHAFFYPHTKCPVCSSKLAEIRRGPDATLVSHTTVRVSPTGSVFRLGLARTPDGAKTLCILGERLDPDRGDEVTIMEDNGLYYAIERTPKQAVE